MLCVVRFCEEKESDCAVKIVMMNRDAEKTTNFNDQLTRALSTVWKVEGA